MKLKKGFTLIELLIVVAIIGILAVALIPAITSGPARARDAARIAAVNNVVSVMETYNLDEGGYPTQTGDGAADCMDFAAIGLALTPPSGGEPDIRSFFGSIPTVDRATDGLCSGGDELMYYRSGATGTNYVVTVEVERFESANVADAVTATNIRSNTAAIWASKSLILGNTGATLTSDATGPFFYTVVQ